jgi:hypothetical protein
MDPNTTKVILAIVAAIAALFAVGFTVRIISNKKSKSDGSINKVKQKNISTFGDVVGRDNNRNRKP